MFKLEFKRSKKYTERRPTLDAIPSRRARPTTLRPVAPTRPERPAAKPTPTSPPPVQSSPSAVVSTPSSHVPKAEKQVTRKKKRTVFILAGIALLIGAASAVYFFGIKGNSSHMTSPEYQTLLPQNKSIDDLGGWKRVSPPEKDPVFAYTDAVEGTQVSVSQQPLPEAFKSDVDSNVAQLAKSYSATDTITVNTTKVYIGRSVKGPQSLIYTKNGVLVLIKSEKKIDDTAWTKYIASLQ